MCAGTELKFENYESVQHRLQFTGIKDPPLAILSVAMKCVAFGTNISSHHAPCKTSHAIMAEHISAPFAPNQDARHSFTVMSPHLLLMHVIFKHHRILTLSPAALLHHLFLLRIPSQLHLCFRCLPSNIFQRIIYQFESYYFVLSDHFSWQTTTAPTRLLLLSHTV